MSLLLNRRLHHTIGGAPVPTFTSSWDTTATSAGSSSSTQVKIPTISGGTYSCHVDWGDASSDDIVTWNDAAWTHTYGASGTYEIKITGIFTGFAFIGTGDRLKLVDVSEWGPLLFGSTNAFQGSSNFTVTATDDMVLPASAYRMFWQSLFNQPSLENVDASGCTNMSQMFYQGVMTGSLDDWDVSNVTTMAEMFSSSTCNPSVANWQPSSLQLMGSIFNSSSFNKPINSWGPYLGNVTDMNSAFATSPFNQSLSTWNVSGVTNMQYLFFNTSAFNQNLSAWVTSSLTNVQNLFQNAAAMNSSVAGWDVSGCTNLTSTFQNVASATRAGMDLSSWDVSNVTNFTNCFMQNGNPNADAWVTTAATTLSNLAHQNSSFSGDLSGWDTDGVTNLYNCFYGTIVNADLSSWVITGVTTAQSLFYGNTALSDANWSALLIGWEAQAITIASVPLHGGAAKYTAGAAATARAALIADHSWTITDGGPV